MSAVSSNSVSAPRLSLCMIVRDEAAYLEECLLSVKDVVAEMIVVDTGSKDTTVSLARKLGATVTSAQWNDDFSEMRNLSLREATGEWILYLDADERLDAASREELRLTTRSTAKQYVSVKINNVKHTGDGGQITRAHRLFRNLPGVQFSGRIHEAISPFFEEIGGEEVESNVRITHLGYARDEAAMHAKRARNARLLDLQVADAPDDPVGYYFKAQNLILAGKHLEASDCLERALQLGGLPRDMQVSIFNNLIEIYTVLCDYERAVAFGRESIAMSPCQTMVHLLLLKVYEKTGDIPAQIASLEAVPGLVRKGLESEVKGPAIEAYVHDHVLCNALGRLYLLNSDATKARAAYWQALRSQPENGEALAGLAQAQIGLERFCAAFSCLRRLARLGLADAAALDKLAWLAIKLQRFDIAIPTYVRLQQLQPQNPQIIRRLAGLYGAVGDSKKAADYLARFRVLTAASTAIPA